MLSKLICELNKVVVEDIIDGTNGDELCCHKFRAGFFDSQIEVESFIRKHNTMKNCFFIMRTYVLNPTHTGQTFDYVTQRTYDYNGNLLCDCPTHRFVVNYKEMFASDKTRFMGRSNNILKRNSTAWFYDEYYDKLCKCIVSDVPLTKKKALKYECLEWYDDSYIVHPVSTIKNNINNTNNHQHIISCFMFTNKYIKDMIKHIE